jgi:predicted nucleotidyltransferase
MTPEMEIDRTKLDDLCRRYSVRRLAFFGSVERDDFTDSSDIDILVEFEEGARIGLAFFSLEEELSQLFGRKVDLNTPGFLSPEFRDRVMREARPVFDAA